MTDSMYPPIGWCTVCGAQAIVNEQERCARCEARGEAYDEGLRDAALTCLYTAADELIVAGWDLEEICDALETQRGCA